MSDIRGITKRSLRLSYECIQGLFGDWVRVALVQLQVPFGQDFLETEGEDGKPIFVWKSMDGIKLKVLSILNNLKKIEPEIRLVVFPEYSIPAEILDDLKSFVDETQTSIIAGSHIITDKRDSNYRQNVCPVLLPHKDILYAKKCVISEQEANRVTPAEKAGCELHWKVGRKELCLQVLLCSDYLSSAWGEVKIDDANPGIIIVPMCSDNVDTFYDLASLHLRCPSGKFVALVNAAYGQLLSPGMNVVGKTALFGSAPSLKYGTPVTTLGSSEEVLVANLNLLEPRIVEERPKTLPPTHGVPLSNLVKYQIIEKQANDEKSWNIVKIKEVGITKGAIHPNVLTAMEKVLRFNFYRVINYPQARNRLAGRNITSYAVFGDYDVVCKTFQREMLTRKHEDPLPGLIEGSTFFTVRKILWYECEPLFEIEYSLEETEKEQVIIPSEGDIEDINKLVENFLTSKVSDGKKRKLIEQRIIIPPKTLASFEDNKDIRAFIFIGFPVMIMAEQMPGIERNMIDRLKSYKDYIVGLYGGFGEPVPYHYLLEVKVDEYNVLNEIITSLHDMQRVYGISVRTRTYPIIDIVKEVPILLTNPKTHEEELSPILNGMTNGFRDVLKKVISQLTESEIRRLRDGSQIPLRRRVDILNKCEALEDLPLDNVKDEISKNELATAKRSFIRAMISSTIIEYSNAITMLAKTVERTLREMLFEHFQSIFGDLDKVQISLGLPKHPRKLTLSELMEAVNKLRGKFPEKAPFDQSLLDDLSLIIEPRNACVHGRYEMIRPIEIEDIFIKVYRAIVRLLRKEEEGE